MYWLMSKVRERWPDLANWVRQNIVCLTVIVLFSHHGQIQKTYLYQYALQSSITDIVGKDSNEHIANSFLLAMTQALEYTGPEVTF